LIFLPLFPAFISGTAYQKLLKENNSYWELLPIGAVHPHPKGDVPGYYADIIINSCMVERVKNFQDLRGAIWATNSRSSISGHYIMLKTLRENGENPSFFGSVLNSGSHLNSIRMVSLKKADVAMVDSNVLGFALSKNPALKDDIHIFDSIGPFPSYPIMVRSSLSKEIKQTIMDALLNLHQVSPWNEQCVSVRLLRFVKVDKESHMSDRESQESVDHIKEAVRYY